jgi:hypothetical protein
MTLTRDEKLIVLIEECGEVIKAATKCLRFGWDRDQLGYGINHMVLAEEIGDLLGMVDSLDLNKKIITSNRGQKLAKAEHAKIQFGRKLASE